MNQELICIETDKNSNNLVDFEHPKRAVYLLGAEDNGLSKEIMDAPWKKVVYIPGRVCLNVASAGSIVLYDRVAKMKGSRDV